MTCGTDLVICAAMGTNVAGSWQKAAKLLQEYSTRQADTQEAKAALRSVQELLVKLEKLPMPPKAVWKKLVQQLQVCCAQELPHTRLATLLPAVCCPRACMWQMLAHTSV